MILILDFHNSLELKGFRLLEIQLKNEMEILLVDFSKEIFYVLLMLLPIFTSCLQASA